MLEKLVFINPIFWIISFLIGFILIIMFFFTKKNYLEFAFFEDIKKIFWINNYIFYVNIFLLFLLLSIFSIIISNPNLKNDIQKINKKWIDIALVFDLSYSMIAEDIKPNRLEVAKKVIFDFAKKLQTDRIWLVVFSWKPFTSIPLTFDYNFVSEFVKNIDIHTINQDYHHLQWTAIWDSLLYWAALFDDSDREKVIVLLTDWEANRWIEPIQALKFIKDKNIKIHTVWIWWYEDTYVTIDNIYWKQKIAIWWIDENILKIIAWSTDWLYYRASDVESFNKLFEELKLLDKKDLEIDKFVIYKPIYKPFWYILSIIFSFFLSFNFYFYFKN